MSRRAFPLVIAALFLALAVAYRLSIGAGLGFGSAHGDAVPTGFLYNLPDNISYAAWARQSGEGAALLTNLYTTEDLPPVYFNPYFYGIGRLAAWTGWQATGLMVTIGLAASALTILCTHRIARSAGVSELGSRCATVLVAFASGLSWPWLTLARWSGRPAPEVGADLRFQDAIPFSTAFAYPYHAVALAMLAVAVVLTLACEARPRNTARAALAAACLLLSSTHPYEGVLLLGTFAVYALHGTVRDPQVRWTRLRNGAAMAAGIVPGLAYALWVSRQPGLSQLAETSVDMARSRSFWLLGYGLVLPLAVLASYGALRRSRAALWWLAFWTVAVALALVGFNVAQSKISNGAYLPMAVLAGHGCARAWERISLLRRPAVRRCARAACLLIGLGCFPTSAYLLARTYENLTYDRGLAQIAREIDASTERFPKVLCDTRAGSMLPALASARVHVGHWSLTPDSTPRRERLVAAGVHRPRGQEWGDADPEVFSTLLEEVQPEFIVLRAGSPAVPLADGLEGFVSASDHPPWRLYRRR